MGHYIYAFFSLQGLTGTLITRVHSILVSIAISNPFVIQKLSLMFFSMFLNKHIANTFSKHLFDQRKRRGCFSVSIL